MYMIALAAATLVAPALFVRAACGANSSNPWQVALPATSQTIDTTFSADLQGTSSDEAYTISISRNTGAVTQNGTRTAVIVKDQIPYGTGLVLYSLIGTTNDSVLTGWAYCTGGNLTSLWLESTEGYAGFTSSTVTGTCDISNSSAAVKLTTEGGCIDVTPPTDVPTINNGTMLALTNGSVGEVTLGSDAFRLLPYTIVDCHDCPSNGLGGWVEVHSLMAAKASNDVCLGIFYLYTTCGNEVTLQYVQCFGAAEPDGDQYAASYDLSPVLGSSSKNCTAAPAGSAGSAGSNNAATAPSASAMLDPPSSQGVLALVVALTCTIMLLGGTRVH